MTIEVREAGNVRIIDLHGRLVLGSTDRLKAEVQGLLARGHSRILLNLKGVPYMDSAGIGELAACKKRVIEKTGQLKVLKPSGRYHLAVETVLNLMFGSSIFDEEKNALGSF